MPSYSDKLLVTTDALLECLGHLSEPSYTNVVLARHTIIGALSKLGDIAVIFPEVDMSKKCKHGFTPSFAVPCVLCQDERIERLTARLKAAEAAVEKYKAERESK